MSTASHFGAMPSGSLVQRDSGSWSIALSGPWSIAMSVAVAPAGISAVGTIPSKAPE